MLVLDESSRAVGCLDSIHQNVSDKYEYEVLALANGTPEDELAPLAQREDIVWIRSSVNLGFGGGNNWASRFARGEFLLFLNDDIEVEAGWLENLVETLQRHPQAGAVGSRLLYPDGRLQEAGALIDHDGWSRRIGNGLAGEANEYANVRPVDYCSACSLLVRKSLWEEYGGFDENYFPAYYEDVDLCYGLRKSGHDVLYDPGSVARHYGGASGLRPWRKFLGDRNRLYFLDKWKNGDGQGSPIANSQPLDGVTAEVLRNELEHARRELALKDAFIAELVQALNRLKRIVTKVPGGRALWRRLDID